MKMPVEPKQMATAEVVGGSLKFSYCDLDRAIRLRLRFAIAFLNEQYALGTVNAIQTVI
jgi:inner membrane protein